MGAGRATSCASGTRPLLALSEQAYAERFDRGLTWARLLEAKHDNLRAALDHWHDLGPTRYLQLAGALGWFWDARTHFAEAARRLEHALRPDPVPDPSLARALGAAGTIDSNRGAHVAGLRRLEKALAVSRSLDDEAELAALENALGWALHLADEQPRALQLFEENLEHARSLNHQGLINRALSGICQELVATGDAARAEPLAEELYVLTRDSEDVWCMSAGDHSSPLRHVSTGLRPCRTAPPGCSRESALVVGDVWQQASELLGFAFTAAGLGRYEDAL